MVFEVNTDGTGYAEIHTFGGTNDGFSPRSRLIFGNDGDLYGTTYSGGTSNFGVVFKMAPDGSGYTILHQFAGHTDGNNPAAGLLCGSDGTLYGTTQLGGITNRTSYGTGLQPEGRWQQLLGALCLWQHQRQPAAWRPDFWTKQYAYRHGFLEGYSQFRHHFYPE